MPRLLTEDGCEFFFYSNEGFPNDLPSVYVRCPSGEAQLILDHGVTIAAATIFDEEIRRKIVRLAFDKTLQIRQAWRGRFDQQS